MLRVTIANQSGFTAPSAGSYTPPVDGSEVPPIPSAYETVDNFSVDITFEGKYQVITPGTVDPITGLAGEDIITYVYQNAVNVTSSYDWASIGVTYSKPNAYTVRLTGPGTNVFTDQYYRYVLPDLTQQVLPADTTVPYYSLVQYQKPSSNSVTLTYPFNVTIPSTYGSGSTTVESVSMSHTYWWAISVAYANIARIKTQGLR